MKRLRRIFFISIITILMILLGYFLFLQSLYGVHPQTVEYYKELQTSVREEGYVPNWVVLSTVRPPWFNRLLVWFGGAASKSQHLRGAAIDIVVLDVNGDGATNATDVDIIYDLLDRKIVRNAGGVGTYKNQSLFIDRQQVHFDSRGRRARWNR